ncbi:tetratricopeptide repeat protein [Halomonas cupida]|uniref:tetratricopeptide repeat protein n=1 Tax=Halomonas cupida TaxID=44933 RepID=UPI003EF39FF1
MKLSKLTCFLLVFFTLFVLAAVFVISSDPSEGCDSSFIYPEDGSERVFYEDTDGVRYSTIPVNIKDLDFVDNGGVQDKGVADYLKGVLYLTGSSKHKITQDYERSAEYLKSAWENGVIDAGYLLFQSYLRGQGVCQDRFLAFEYLSYSASHGFSRSQRDMGMAYLDAIPLNVEKNYAEAKDWFESAYSLGDKISAVNLAMLYYQGFGVEKNESRAFSLLKMSEQLPYGSVFSGMMELGLFYERGIGTDVDLVQAYKYYDLLSPSGDDDKARIAEQMTPDQIREAISLSRQWQEEHNIFVPSYYGLEYQEDGTFQ